MKEIALTVLIGYHKTYVEIDHAEDVTPKYLYHLEEKFYLQVRDNKKQRLGSFLEVVDLLEIAGQYMFISKLLKDINGTVALCAINALSDAEYVLGNIEYSQTIIEKALVDYKDLSNIELYL